MTERMVVSEQDAEAARLLVRVHESLGIPITEDLRAVAEATWEDESARESADLDETADHDLSREQIESLQRHRERLESLLRDRERLVQHQLRQDPETVAAVQRRLSEANPAVLTQGVNLLYRQSEALLLQRSAERSKELAVPPQPDRQRRFWSIVVQVVRDVAQFWRR